MLELAVITGFETTAHTVEIFDGAARPFYFLENKEGKRVTFNLPPGKYLPACEIKPLEKPLRYVCPELPKKEKSVPVVPELDITVGSNPNKASYKNATGEMFIDYSIWNKAIPERRFVMGHELAHTYYFTEWKCDVFSAAKMLERGYNPSQCFYANHHCLSDAQEARKKILYDFLRKVKCYE